MRVFGDVSTSSFVSAARRLQRGGKPEDFLKISEINEGPLHLKAWAHLQHKGCSNCWLCGISLC